MGFNSSRPIIPPPAPPAPPAPVTTAVRPPVSVAPPPPPLVVAPVAPPAVAVATPMARPVIVADNTADKTILSIQKICETEKILEKKRDLMNKQGKEQLALSLKFDEEEEEGAARMCFKRSEMYAAEVCKLEDQLVAISKKKLQMQGEHVMGQIFDVLVDANEATLLHEKNMSLGALDKLIENDNEIIDRMNLFADGLKNYGGASEVDEDELVEKFQKAKAKAFEKKAAKAPVTPARAAVVGTAVVTPSGLRKASHAATENDLAELGALMAVWGMWLFNCEHSQKQNFGAGIVSLNVALSTCWKLASVCSITFGWACGYAVSKIKCLNSIQHPCLS